jgi:hypothetical protein
MSDDITKHTRLITDRELQCMQALQAKGKRVFIRRSNGLMQLAEIDTIGRCRTVVTFADASYEDGKASKFMLSVDIVEQNQLLFNDREVTS